MNEIVALYIGSDLDVTREGTLVEISGAYLNAGTCTFTLIDAGIRLVSGRLVASSGGTVVSGPTTMTYVAASSGIYRGVLESTVTSTLTDRAYYYLDIVFNEGSYDDTIRLTCQAQYRGAPALAFA